MAPQTVLITGCSSGMGLAVAVHLAKATQHEVKEARHKCFTQRTHGKKTEKAAQENEPEFKVYATMRNLDSRGKLEAAAGDTLNKTLFIRALDVTKEATISSVVGEILRENGKIDVLINNAGFSFADAIDQMPMEKCHAMMDTNYWGVVRTTRAVLPAMKKQKSGRILNVASICGVLATPFFATYSSSKFAVEGFSECIASTLLAEYNIRVSLLEPGPVSTNLLDNLTDEEKNIAGFEETIKTAYKKYLKEWGPRMAQFLQTTEEVSKLVLEIISSPEPHLRYQTSKAISGLVATKFKDVTTDALLKGF